MKPKLRNIADSDIYSLIINGVRQLLQDKNYFPFQSCINCEYWNKDKETCNLYKQRPPANVIVYACDSYEDVQDIPF